MIASPFLRWAGGKTRVLPDILPRIPAVISGRYREIFVGGGAVFFALSEREWNGPIRATLSDCNEALINAYNAVRDRPGDLVNLLDMHASKNSEAYFYQIRATKWESEITWAAGFIYLNKTCFNGLHRVNASGNFNVPWGKLKNPNIVNEATILACSRALQGVELRVCGFDAALLASERSDFVYADPPYLDPDPNAFTAYAKRFTHSDAQRLSEMMHDAQLRGVRGLISNADNELTRDAFEIYNPHDVPAFRKIHSIDVRRSVGASAATRKTAPEILVECFPC